MVTNKYCAGVRKPNSTGDCPNGREDIRKPIVSIPGHKGFCWDS